MNKKAPEYLAVSLETGDFIVDRGFGWFCPYTRCLRVRIVGGNEVVRLPVRLDSQNKLCSIFISADAEDKLTLEGLQFNGSLLQSRAISFLEANCRLFRAKPALVDPEPPPNSEVA